MELGSFAHYAPAWLQPCAFGAAAAGLIGATRGGRARRLAALTLLPVLAAALVLALVPAAREAASVTLGYLSRSEAQIATVHESRPVWQAGARFVQQYTWLLVLVPPMPLHAAWRAWLGKDEERALWTAFVFWLAGTGFLAAMQLRLGLMFAPLACLALPAMLGDFAERLGAATGRPRAVRAALAVALAAVLVPLLSLHRPLAVSGARPFLKSYDALEWLGRGAARPGEAEELGSKASFAVAARWQWGHWLNYVSGQANIANPLGQTAQNLRGVRRSTSFFLAEDAKAAGRLADELGIRYTLATPVIEEVREIAAHAGRSPGRYLRTGDDGAPVVEAAFLRTMNSRLLHFDGTGFAVSGSREGPLRRWRMVFECRAPTEVLGRKAAYCKVFERVAGARVRVRTSPGGVVLLGLRLRTNNGRVFEWGDAALADDSGVARLRAPYAAGGGGPVSNGAVTALGPYQLEIEGRRRTLSVGEAAVLEGGSLSVE